jgi:plastocyanin
MLVMAPWVVNGAGGRHDGTSQRGILSMPRSGCENVLVLRGGAPTGNVSTSGSMETRKRIAAMTRVRAGLLGVAIVTLVAGVATPRVASGGSVKGTVLLKGVAPEARKLAVTIDQYVCGKEKSAEDLVLSPQGGIRNAVVWLENPPPAPTAAAPPPVTAVDQKECVFTPRVVVVAAGGRIDFLNSDRLLHNLHSTPKANPPFNRAQPKGRTIPITFPHPEIIRVSCDLHSWMRGWVVVAEHPFYAVTDADGRFALPGLPPGRYTVRVWQERLGTISREIVVGDADPTAITLEMTAR